MGVAVTPRTRAPLDDVRRRGKGGSEPHKKLFNNPLQARAHFITLYGLYLSHATSRTNSSRLILGIARLALLEGDLDAWAYGTTAAWRRGTTEDQFDFMSGLRETRPEWFRDGQTPEDSLPSFEQLRDCPLPLNRERSWDVFAPESERRTARALAQEVARVMGLGGSP